MAPEGIQNYQVPPPHQYLELTVQSVESNQAEFEDPPFSDVMVAYEKESLPDDQELEKCIDREEDRIVDCIVGCKIKALFENGWFVDKINYYNKSLEEYHVSYEGNTECYISLKDLNGVEVPLL